MPASSKHVALLDGARIRALRHLAGLSIRRLATSLSVSPTTITRLEDNTNHADLPLRLVTDLAATLGVAPAEIFPRVPGQPARPGRDDQTLEAALATTRAATSASDLATALEWDLARVRRALELLDERLHHTGQRLHDHGWQRHALRPATEHLSEQQQHALHRIGPAQRGLTAETATLLAQVADGTITPQWRKNASASQEIALQSLLKQGLITADAHGRFQLRQVVKDAFFPEPLER